MADEDGKTARREYHKAWRAANKELVASYRDANRDRIRRQNRESYSRNKEKRRALRMRCYWANPSANAAYMKKWVEANRDKSREIGRRSAQSRRARLRGAFVEPVDPATVFARDSGICGICGHAVGTDRWEIDHKVPLALGGHHSYANVQLAHMACNRSKGAKCA